MESRCSYALSRGGEVMPWNIIADGYAATQPYDVFALRAMIAVPYFEKVRAWACVRGCLCGLVCGVGLVCAFGLLCV